MIRIVDIALKDLAQFVRDRKTFMFLLLMPVTMTVLFGYAFGGFGGGESDARLPVGYLDEDHSRISADLKELLAASDVIRLNVDPGASLPGLERQVAENKLAAAIVVPPRYGKTILSGRTARLHLIADTGTPAGTTIQATVLGAANRLDGAVRTASAVERVSRGRVRFDHAFDRALSAWDDPPITVAETSSTALEGERRESRPLEHTSPGMMLQFAIAGLLTAAQILVQERKSRALQRLLTTPTRRSYILFGHYLAILVLILVQFILLILFGQIVLNVGYLREPGATLLVAASAALCIAALGLLIGVVARSEEQAMSFSLVAMFLLAGLGGAWVPLEVTGETFRVVGHLSPVAWAMDGFQNIVVSGRGLSSSLLPATALTGYAVLIFLLAAWRFQAAEEH